MNDKRHLILFCLLGFYSSSYAESLVTQIAKIGQFTVIKENCDGTDDACDYNLYEGENYRLPLVVKWQRGLNIENETSQFLHFSYGYTFNIHHSIFVSNAGIVQALDEVIAVDPKSGCIAQYSQGFRAPSISFRKVFTAKVIKVADFDKKYPKLDQNLQLSNDYFIEPKFNKRGDFSFTFEYQHNKRVVIRNPCLLK